MNRIALAIVLCALLAFAAWAFSHAQQTFGEFALLGAVVIAIGFVFGGDDDVAAISAELQAVPIEPHVSLTVLSYAFEDRKGYSDRYTAIYAMRAGQLYRWSEEDDEWTAVGSPMPPVKP